ASQASENQPASRENGFDSSSLRSSHLNFSFQHFSFQLLPRGLTEPILALHSPDASRPCHHRLAMRQASALFGPRTMTDSPAFRPLHSAAAIRFGKRKVSQPTRKRFRSVSSVRKLARPSGTARARPMKQDVEGREASPDQDPQYGRDAPHVARETAIGRKASPGQDLGNSREPGQL